jgi:hypothetical protein
MVVVQRQANLLEIVLALGPAGRFASLLNCRQQQGDEYGNDGDDNQQLDERKTATTNHLTHPFR